MSWAPLPVEADPDAVTARLLAALTDRLNPDRDPAGWAPREGAPEVVLAEEIGRETAGTNARAAEAAEVAAAGFGVSLYGFAPVLAAPASLPVRFTLTAAGATVPAGLAVVGRTDDGVDVAFRLLAPVTAAPGALTVDATLTAQVTGSVGNGVPTGRLTIISTTAAVDTATATATSGDGVDAEDRATYLSRLVEYVAILRPGGVRASDLAVLARSVPGVARAMVLDLYDADTNTDNVERTATVYPIDAAGQPVGAGVLAAVRALLESVREINFRLRTGVPTYSPVTVAVTAVAEVGADPVAVAAAVRAAVLGHLAPATWGATDADPGAWVPTSLVRYLPLVTAAGSVPGVLYLSGVTVNGGTVDVTLPGRAALPAPATGVNPSTVAVTVT